ncbi:MAG: Tad domain-containing protein [Anaerolineales bacterium]|nr:Tad domain-containing protein [Anaerolineales bacterium]
MKAQNRQESGQAIIFLVVGLVVFLGFVGLAIDGGMAYSDRRHAQNSVDAASLAGGGILALEMDNHDVRYTAWDCNSVTILAAMAAGRQTAVTRAAANGYAIDEDAMDMNGVQTTCSEVDYGYIERWIDVTVLVSDTTTTSFAQLFFPDALQINTEAVTRVRPRSPLAYGNAIVALNPESCLGHQNGAMFSGDEAIYVDGGGVWTNGCLRSNGNPDVHVTNGGVSYVGEWDSMGNWTVEPTPVKVNFSLPPESYHVPLPDCTGHWVDDGYITDPDNQPLSGLYCITGNFNVNGNDVVIGQGVTFYIPNGNVRIDGNAKMQVYAPPADPDPSPAIPGVVLYVPNEDPHTVHINGTADSFWQGTILAPSTDVEIMGTGYIDAYRTQVIGWNVRVGGTANTYVHFDDSLTYLRPTSLELAK